MAKFTITPPSGQPVTVEAGSQAEAMDHVLNLGGPDVSALGSLGRGAVGMLPLGNQAYAGVAGAVEHKPYLQERQELDQEIQADKETNPGARLTGQALGVAAPIVATAGLAAPETLLGAAGQGALFGGAFGAGNAVDTLAGGGSGADAAKDVALGAGLGAAGGAAGEGLSKLAGEGVEALANSKLGQRLHVENISKALGLNPGSLKALGKTTGDTPEMAAQNIWKDIQAIPELPENFVHPTGSINEKLEMLKALKDKAGSDIGVARESGGAATAGNFPEGMQAAKDLVSQAENYVGIPDGSQESMKAIAAQLQAAENAGKLDFNQMSQIRSAVGDQVRRDIPGSHQIYRTLSENLDKALDRVGDTAGIDKQAFQTARKTYATTSKIIPLMQRGAGREASGTGGGLSNLLGIGGTLTGHPAAAVAPVMHEAQKLAAPELIHNVLLGGTGAAGKVAGANAPRIAAQVASSQAPTDIHLQHPAMTPWRETFAKNAAQAKDPGEVAKANAVTDFTLSQRDPAYAKAKQTASETPEQGKRPQNMAEGGIVQKIKDFKGLPSFGSTLAGLDTMAHKAAGDESPVPVRSTVADGPFNPQMAEQLQAYMLKRKDANAE